MLSDEAAERNSTLAERSGKQRERQMLFVTVLLLIVVLSAAIVAYLPQLTDETAADGWTATVSNSEVVEMEGVSTGTLTVTVSNEFGTKMTDGTVFAVNVSNGEKYSAPVGIDSVAVLAVASGSYTLFMADGYVSSSNTTITITEGGAKTAVLTAYTAKAITVKGIESGTAVSLMALGFNTSSTTDTLYVPSVGGINSYYTAYAVSGNVVYSGYGNGNVITTSTAAAAAVAGTILNQDGTATIATIAFIKTSGETFVFTSGMDGKFSVIVPIGDYTVYAFDGTDSVYLASLSVTGDRTLGSISMVDGRSVISTLNYETRTSGSTTRGLAYCDITANLNYNSVQYSINLQTNSSGRAIFWAPNDTAVTCFLSKFSTNAFVVAKDCSETAEASSTNHSLTAWTFSGVKNGGWRETSGTLYVNTTPVTCDHVVNLIAYSDSTLTYVLSGNACNVIPGQYTAVMKNESGRYFNDTVYIDPGMTKLTLYGIVDVATVTITAATDDSVTAIAVQNSDGKTGRFFEINESTHTFYVQAGFDYCFKAVSSIYSSDYSIAYADVSGVVTGAKLTLNLISKTVHATINGDLGVSADGFVIVTYTDVHSKVVKVPFAVSEGSYQLVVPSNTDLVVDATLSQKVDSVTYTYAGSTSIAAEDNVDGAKCTLSLQRKEAVVSEISLTASPVTGGTVAGSGSYAAGVMVTITASANSGYHFVKWSDGVTDATRTITVGTVAGEYTAEFAANSGTDDTTDGDNTMMYILAGVIIIAIGGVACFFLKRRP